MYECLWYKNIKRSRYVSSEKEDQVFKTIKIKKAVWRKLNYLKLEEDAKTISEIINKLVDFYKSRKQ